VLRIGALHIGGLQGVLHIEGLQMTGKLGIGVVAPSPPLAQDPRRSVSGPS
jgi:hypothetical protein